jgi:hypothetical protein
LIPIRESDGATTFAVQVHSRARKSAITGELGDALKVSLTAPPVSGKANDGCIEFFAKLLKVPRSSVTIASGQTSRQKVVRVSGLSAEEIRRRIGIWRGPQGATLELFRTLAGDSHRVRASILGRQHQ